MIEGIIERLKGQQFRGSTRRNYRSVWKGFNEFFIKLDVKPLQWEERIILFVRYLIQHRKAKSQTIRSYLSAIRATLQNEGIKLKEDRFLLNLLTHVCKLTNDSFRVCLPIQKPLLIQILSIIDMVFQEQIYLAVLYKTLLATTYFGLFRVSELTEGEHEVKVTEVHMGENKKKILFMLRSSKTHGKYSQTSIDQIVF